MPLALPGSPTVGQQYSYGAKTYRWTGSFWAATASEYTGYHGHKTDIRAAIIAKGVAVPAEAPLADYDTYIAAISGGAPLTAPATITSGQWTATLGNTLITVNITALPADGGSAITALQYRLNGGTWTSFVGTGTGSRNITGLTNGTPYDVEIRAINVIGDGAASDVKTRTPAVGSANILETLLTGSPFAFAIVPSDPTITRCYVETTGASATTLCTDGQEIGTIECVPLGTYITFPSGVKPLLQTSGADAWIEMQAGGKISYTYGADYTGTGQMLMAFSGTRGNESGCVLTGAGNNADDPMWYGTTRGAVEINGTEEVIFFRGTGGQVIPDVTVLDTEPFVTYAVMGETTRNAEVWKVGAGTDYGVNSGTWADAGGWNCRKVWLGSRPDEATIFVGRLHAAMVIRADTDSTQRAALADYLGALNGVATP